MTGAKRTGREPEQSWYEMLYGVCAIHDHVTVRGASVRYSTVGKDKLLAEPDGLFGLEGRSYEEQVRKRFSAIRSPVVGAKLPVLAFGRFLVWHASGLGHCFSWCCTFAPTLFILDDPSAASAFIRFFPARPVPSPQVQ